MSGYQYTYPAGLSYLDDLPSPQRTLALNVYRRAQDTGADLADVLRGADAPATDKAAVAVKFGGPDAAREFLP